MRIVLTRESGRNESMVEWLPSDAEIEEVPLTATRFYDESAVATVIRSSTSFGSFRALVVTSARSARYAKLATRALASSGEVLSVGAATTRALDERGVEVRAQSAGAATDLVGQVLRGPVLVLGAETMRDELTTALRERGLFVQVVVCYETMALTPDERGIQSLRDADVVMIGAPSAWSVAAPFVRSDAWVVVPGATTAATVRVDHHYVVEGWGPSLRQRLAAL